jgi:hypothetical protein
MNQRGSLDPSIFLSPTFWLGALIVALSLSNVLFYNLYQGATNDLANFKSAVEQASKRADDANAARVRAAEDATRDAARLYAERLDSVDRSYRSRLDGLLRSHRACETNTLVARTTAGIDAGQSDSRPAADPYGAACRRLEQDCAKTTLMHDGLRAYVRGLCKTWGCE